MASTYIENSLDNKNVVCYTEKHHKNEADFLDSDVVLACLLERRPHILEEYLERRRHYDSQNYPDQ